MDKANAYIASTSKVERVTICALLEGGARTTCEKEPSLDKVFSSVSVQLCGGCVRKSGTYEELSNVHDKMLLRQNDTLSQIVREKRSELASLAQQIEAGYSVLREQAAAADTLAESAEKIQACKEEAARLLPQKVAAQKKHK